MKKLTQYWSDNGKREATIYVQEETIVRYYIVETREKGMHQWDKAFRTLELAEISAESWVEDCPVQLNLF